MLLLPGLDSTKEEFFLWENVFLDRGHGHVLAATGRARARAASRRASAATTRPAVGAALDALASRDDLDHDRVGAAGVSLGGYYAPRAARSSRA